MKEIKECRRPGIADKKKRYQALDIRNKLIWNLRDLGHTVRMLSESKGSQKRVLMLLAENGSMTQSELTAMPDIKPGSASEVLAKLEAAGLICRTEYLSDRRTVNVGLTEKGKAEAEKTLEERRLRHLEMFSSLTDEEMSELLILLEKLNSAWNKQFYDEKKGKAKEDEANS